MASFRAHLSPNEQTTLRRIAIDALAPGEVREMDAKRLIALELIKEEDGLLVPTSRGLERLQLDNPQPSAIQSAMAENTRRYSIQIVDLAAGRDVIITVVDWTDEEKRVAVGRSCAWLASRKAPAGTSLTLSHRHHLRKWIARRAMRSRRRH
jgi:hypothetical protein